MDHLMFYGLTRDPFDKSDSVIVPTIDYKELTKRLNYLTETRGIGLVTGRPGVGKTVILRDFAQSLDGNRYRVSYLPLSTVSVSEFYNQLITSVGVEPAYGKARKFHQLQERISEMHDIEHLTPVFIIDEAQMLNGGIFNELMIISNFGMDAAKKCVIILAGAPILAQTLQRAQYEAFRQRITIGYQVVGVEATEAAEYIKRKLSSAGVVDEIIDADAQATIISSAGGSLRRLNRMITQCLIIGAAKGKKQIDNEVVFAASEELAAV